tara:strand:+ start:354 stop:1106 length:753 start_codon:yes stop_codon:yes gene_type:complete
MKANNLSNRYFFINQSASDSQYARVFPMSNLTCLHMDTDSILFLTFEDSYVGDHNLITISVEAEKGKEAIKNIVDVINSTQQIAVLADKSTGESIIDNINFSGTLDVSGGSAGTFSLSGTLTVAGAATFTTGSQNTAVARTATADGTDTGTIAAGTSFVTLTSGGANTICILPAPVIGNIIYISEDGTTGYELRSSAPASIGINGGTASNAESAIAGAITYIKCVCVSATNWICSQYDADGDESKVEVAS